MKKNLIMIAVCFAVLALSACQGAVTQSPVGSDAEFVAMDYVQDFVPEFARFSGTVIEINESWDEAFFVLVEGEANEEGYVPQMNFNVTQDSILLFDNDIEVGMEVAGYYNTSMPVPMIYPPQHVAIVLAPLSEDWVTVSRFGEGLLSSDIGMQLNIDDDTEVILQDGSPFDFEFGSLEHRALIVVHSIMDFTQSSIPMQTTPSKVIVLFEMPEHPTLLLTQEDLDIMWDNMLDPETVQIFVDGEAIDAPTPFVNREYGVVMVPLGAIAEALGYDVLAESNEIMIGQNIRFTIDGDYPLYGILGAAPELHDNVIFVPLHFFGSIIPAGAYIADGNIFVSEDIVFEESFVEYFDDDWMQHFTIIIDNGIGIDAELYTADDYIYPTHVPMIPVLEIFYGALEGMVVRQSDPPIVSLNGWNGPISFTGDSGEFTVDGETIILPSGHGAITVNGEIYVPILFFSEVFGLGNAFWSSGHVHIFTEYVEMY